MSRPQNTTETEGTLKTESDDHQTIHGSFKARGLPEPSRRRPVKDAGGPDWRKQHRQKALRKDLDPEVQRYQIPDFGFCDDLNNDGKRVDLWDIMFDNVR